MSTAPTPVAADDPAGSPTEDVLSSGAAGGKAIRGGAFRTIGYGVGLLLSLGSVPFMIRHLGPVDYGHYVTVASIVFIIGGVTEAGLTNLGVREYSVLEGEARDAYLRNLVGLRVVLTVGGVLLATGVAAVTGAKDVVVAGVFVSGVGLLIGLTQQTYMIPLTATLRLGWVTILDLLKQAVLSGLFVLFVILGTGLMPFFWASVASAGVMTGATLVLVRRQTPLRPAVDLATWRAILRETLPYAAAAAVGLIYFRIAVVLMSYVSSDVETGYFSAAFRIVEVVGVIPWLLVSAGFPILARAARDDDERLRYALQRMFDVATVVGTGIALGLGVGAPFAVEVIAGDGFEPSVDVLRIQALGLITTFLVATWMFALLSLKLYRQLLWANTLAAVVAIGGTLALAPGLGAQGAAIATVAAEAALALACVWALRSARAVLRPDLSVLPKVMLAAGIAIGVSLVLPGPAVVLSVVAGLVYLAVLVPLRAIPPELVAALLRRDPGAADAP